VTNTTISFINFLGRWGPCILKNKLQFAETEQPFHLFVNVNKGVALGVLTQNMGGGCQCQPMAFLHKFLDPITQDWLECFQAVAAIALLTKESRKITFGEI
jgi:hypothetical protein